LRTVTHDERLDLARELTQRLIARHGLQAILAVGLHGPVARGDDGDDSDLDVAVITTAPEVEVPARVLRHRGLVIDLGAIAAEDYLEEAGHIGPLWPLAADQYLHHLALHDPTGFFAKLRQAHESAVASSPPETFLAAAGYDLVELVSWEARARADELNGDVPGALLAVKEGAVLAALVIGLVRRTPFRNAGHALRAAATVTGVPGGFTEQYRRLLSPTIDPASAVLALGRVLDALEELARQEGIPFEAEDLDDFL
jgi:predicted nucleotidyltransferase